MMGKDGTTQRKQQKTLRRDKKTGLTMGKDDTTQGKQPETLRRGRKTEQWQESRTVTGKQDCDWKAGLTYGKGNDEGKEE